MAGNERAACPGRCSPGTSNVSAYILLISETNTICLLRDAKPRRARGPGHAAPRPIPATTGLSPVKTRPSPVATGLRRVKDGNRGKITCRNGPDFLLFPRTIIFLLRQTAIKFIVPFYRPGKVIFRRPPLATVSKFVRNSAAQCQYVNMVHRRGGHTKFSDKGL